MSPHLIASIVAATVAAAAAGGGTYLVVAGDHDFIPFEVAEHIAHAAVIDFMRR